MNIISNNLIQKLDNHYGYDILDASRSTNELAIKCKEWSQAKGYFLLSGYESFDGVTKACCYVSYNEIKEVFFDDNLNLERNCIIAAAEYVLTQLQDLTNE